ncbi:hypothetical protein [Hymenobacter elongatus]|uniref:Uncharacterized protein n=1 Tax=Hymenobacter elongatus TaxID=877208 RepID=A0A4Z0PKJ5_9BACT|nr:hypothetical protein [Hymenobacter elongatus]TGE16115.1 hypothetical protein E5J99_10635 [Hymenobacter elongatus]
MSNPAGPLLINATKDFGPVLAPLRQKLQAQGYRVITEPDTLRQLLEKPSAPRFLYADIVCYQWAGNFPTVVFAVRDSLNVPLFVKSESTTLFLSQQKAYSSAASRMADELPISPTAPAPAPSTLLANRAPQFVAYDTFGFVNYVESVLTTAPLRQQLKRGSVLALDLRIDALGFATLQAVGNQLALDSSARRALEAAVRNTPPWCPAYQNGRRTAVDVHTSLGRN